jgi:hypothetical protein
LGEGDGRKLVEGILEKFFLGHVWLRWWGARSHFYATQL